MLIRQILKEILARVLQKYIFLVFFILNIKKTKNVAYRKKCILETTDFVYIF